MRENQGGSITGQRPYKQALAEAKASAIPPAPSAELEAGHRLVQPPTGRRSRAHGKARRRKAGKKK